MPSPLAIGRAFHALHHVIGEDAVAALEVGALEGLLAGAAGGQREQALVADRPACGSGSPYPPGVMAPEWQASVSRIFDFALILPPITLPSSSIG